MYVDPTSAKSVAGLTLRLSLGLSLIIIGLNHYMNFDPFRVMVESGLGPITFLGTVWAFVVPALEIVGGALLAIRRYGYVAAWTAGAALGSIPVGLLLKTLFTGEALDVYMPTANDTFIWILVFYFAAKTMSCCCGPNCNCTPGAPVKKGR